MPTQVETGNIKPRIQINADGELPNELKRRSRALSYHNFALQPLVLLVFAGEK